MHDNLIQLGQNHVKWQLAVQCVFYVFPALNTLYTLFFGLLVKCGHLQTVYGKILYG